MKLLCIFFSAPENSCPSQDNYKKVWQSSTGDRTVFLKREIYVTPPENQRLIPQLYTVVRINCRIFWKLCPVDTIKILGNFFAILTLSYFFSAPENHALHRTITKKYGRARQVTQNGVFEKINICYPTWESKIDSTALHSGPY